MKSFKYLGLVCLLATASLAEEDKASVDEKDVLVLTKDNFKDTVADNEYVLVEFYAPWCGHCKALTPEYAKAATMLKEKGSNIKLGKVDATTEKELAEEYEIRGYPTLKYFKNGTPIDFKGNRDAKSIAAWCEKKTGPAAKPIETVADTEALEKEGGVVIYGLFKDQESEAAKEFLKAAENVEDHQFAMTSSKELFKKFGKDKDSVVLIKDFDDKRADFDGEKIVEEELHKFIRLESLPLINEFSQETANRIFGSDVKAHLLLVSSKTKDHEKNLENLLPTAKANKGKIIFVHVDGDNAANLPILEFFGFKPEDLPKYLVFAMETSSKYISDAKEVEDKEVAQFVQDYFDGKLKKTLKNADLADDWDAKPVKELNSVKFSEIALDKTKDVFVEFYAPWCGHCKALTPKWDELGEKFKDSDSVVIAKIDATANEVSEVEVEGFPTLKLFKKETNEIVDYKGKREVDAMVKFVETYDQGDVMTEAEEQADYDEAMGGDSDDEAESDDEEDKEADIVMDATKDEL